MMGLWLLAGSVAGTVNGLTRWWTVSRLKKGMRMNPVRLVWGAVVLRLALVTALLSLGLSRGILPGMLAFAGLWFARWATTIWFGALSGMEGQRLTAPSAE